MNTLVSPTEYDLAVRVQKGLMTEEQWVDVMQQTLERAFDGLLDGSAYKDNSLLADLKRLQTQFRVWLFVLWLVFVCVCVCVYGA
jgi:hypothetical protein